MDVGSSVCVIERDFKRYRQRRSWLFSAVLVIGLSCAATATAASFEVDSSSDTADAAAGDGACETTEGVCTLRAAIEETEATEPGESVTISFAQSVQEIAVQSVLPALNRSVSIVGRAAGGGPLPVIDGSGVSGGNGLTLRAGGSITNLTVLGFPGYGVVLRNGTITGSYLGVLPDGVTVRSNDSGGINALGTTTVGAPRTNGESCSGPCNLIAGNRDSQVNIGEIGATIIGNQIGILADGSIATGTRDVIRLPGGTLVPTAMVTIGGSAANANVIAAPAGAVSVRVFRALGPPSQSVHLGENVFIGPGSTLLDLDLGGQLPNDSGDGDAGPNGLLNFPYLRTANVNPSCSLGLDLITSPGRVVDAWLVLNNGRIEHAFSITEGSSGDTSSEVDSYDDPQLGSDSGNVLATEVNLRSFAEASGVILVATDALGNSSESVVFELPDDAAACTSVCYSDRDGDGVTGSREQIVSGRCSDVSTNGTTWTSQTGGDCADDPSSQCATVSAPGETEICDGCDNDCDGMVDDEDDDIADGDPSVTGANSSRFYPDADGDGCGIATGSGFYACDVVEGFASNQLDSDDSDGICCGNGTLDPGEQCDGEAVGSATCPDGSAGTPVCLNDPRHPDGTDECRFRNGAPFGCSFGRTCFADLDGDGFTGTIVSLDSGDERACSEISSGPLATPWTAGFGGDCEDRPTSACALDTFPGATEICDGCDNDCDPETPDGMDEPAFGQPCDGPDLDLCPEGTIRCGPVSHELECLDLTDTTVELCDAEGLDEDCDGLVNSDDPSIRNLPAEDIRVLYPDNDGDGCGVFSERTFICAQDTVPDGFALIAGDLDDTDGDCCGDGLITGAEECDRALEPPLCSEFGSGQGVTICEQDCKLSFAECANSRCGDGTLSGEETCDPASDFAPDNCRDNCTFCGDGVLDADSGERCDPFASGSPDTCRDDCTFCGDGIVSEDAGETCDPAAPGAPETCDPVSCTTCGDGVLEPEFGEECDEGQSNSDTCEYGETSCQVCSTTCESTAGLVERCGDGVVQSEQGETCDDGNAITEACDDADCEVCTANCKLVSGSEPQCGDGVVQAFTGEECEPGIGDAAVSCDDDCTLSSAGDSGGGGCATSSSPHTRVPALLILVGVALLATRRSTVGMEKV